MDSHSLLVGFIIIGVSLGVWAMVTYLTPTEGYDLTMIFKQEKEIPDIDSPIGTYWIGKKVGKDWIFYQYSGWTSYSIFNTPPTYLFTQEQVHEYFKLGDKDYKK